MTTPVYGEFVRLLGDTDVHLGTALMMCRNFESLRRLADSTGTDLEVGQVDGMLARDRHRGGLVAELVDIQIDGSYDDGDPVGTPTPNALSTLRSLIEWPDNQVGRRFTVELNEYGDIYQADAAFERWGVVSRPAPHIFEVTAIISVASGKLELVP